MGVNRAFAHRYWSLASLQRSPHALIRLGDYAFNGWGVEAVPTTQQQKERMLVGLADDDVMSGDEEADTLVDTDGRDTRVQGFKGSRV